MVFVVVVDDGVPPEGDGVVVVELDVVLELGDGAVVVVELEVVPELGDGVVVVVVDDVAGGVAGGVTTVVDDVAGGGAGGVDGWQAPSASSTLAATAVYVRRVIVRAPLLV